MQKYAIINFLRGWSIFTIVLMHLVDGFATGVFAKIASFGGAGVHVFILCSGFGLYLSFLRKPIGYLDFLKRRFSKVWIPYAIAILLWALWLLITTYAFPLQEVAAHLMLYKMFSTELDTSLCYPYWFISTIVQFYLFWPLILKVYRARGGGQFLLVASLLWSTFVGLMGLEEERPWGSFFFQYLWEFGLGMWIAERCMKVDGNNVKFMNVDTYKWWWLLLGAIGGMGLSAFMAWNGGILKLYNDIPSLMGYLSLALLIYKFGVKVVNRFFEWANSFSYELYLVHSLVFAIVAYFTAEKIPTVLLLPVSFVAAYLFAYLYRMVTKKMTLTCVELKY